MLELPPPGAGFAGFTTAICSVPALVTSLAGTIASKVVVLTKNVCRGVFPIETTDCETKFVPIKLSVTAPLPAVIDEGETDEICGVGLTVGLIVNVSASVIPPPG